ncbi:SPX, N-terminal [Lasallia pustulata]|uniref:SPX, N-terminal n=1 Tax=Lasallia pustulata TaxID=136370 RepID=A0A1W5DEQ4_9LECA|nr:SPX, N-terminal [Lasallia pustulata]
MRFGQRVHGMQIPQWAPFYFNYNAFKRIVKAALTRDSEAEAKAQSIEVLDALIHEIASVDSFYNDTFARIYDQEKRLPHQNEALHATIDALLSHVDERELSEFFRAAAEVREDILSLQWYGKVNHDGLHRILVKLQGAWANDNQIQESLDRSIIHRFVIKIGRDRKSSILQASAASLSENQYSVNLLKNMFQRMQPRQQHGIWEKDSLGRLPIHYAAAYGLPKTCLFLLSCMQTRHWDKDQSLDSTDDVLMRDLLGYTPLHLAVVGKHTEATKILLAAHSNRFGSETITDDEPLKILSGELLAIALSSESHEIIEALLDAGVDVTYRNDRGETLPYIASRAGHERWVSRLLDIHSCRTEHINTPELAYGRTPLLIASAQGNLAIVEVLTRAGADHTARNYFGWSALELAAYRGHMAVMKFLGRVLLETTTLAGGLFSKDLGVSSLPCAGSFRKAKSLIARNAFQGNYQNTRHETQIVLNLGSLDTRKSSPAVDLGSYTEFDGAFPGYQTSFSLELSVIGAEGPRYIIHLPVLDDTTNMPCVFSAKDPSDVKVSIQVFRESTPVGCGIALLDHLRNGLGSHRESLVRDFTIPILERKSFRFIGTVTITVIVVTPFRHSTVVQPAATDVWKNPACTQLVGHRGLGENFAKSERLQLGENSIQSFLTALDLGASCLELGVLCFDVQMTKDHVPVIYHDYLTSETGTDSPMHTLSFEQFMYLSKSQSHRSDRASCADREASVDLDSQERRRRRAFSLSTDACDERRAQDFIDRMRPTFEWGYKGYKGNTRGCYIHELFVTLEEALLKVPERFPINIEIKYSVLWEAAKWEMDIWTIELNTFLDGILEKIYRFARSRVIIFSSFAPEICIALRFKQHDYPVLFLNEAGLIPTSDVRASSMQDAVHFARSWALDGIVEASDPLVFCPRLIGLTKSHDLICASWGLLNNDPKSAKIQAEAGLDAIIADDVHKISKALAEDLVK